MGDRTGACLCGAVRIEAKITEPKIGACHCAQCRRWTGGSPLMTVPVTDLRIQDEDFVHEFQISDWGVRAFCKKCGSNIYWRMADGEVKSIAVGLLDDQSGLTVTEEIFADCRAPWMQPVPGASQSTEAEQLALLDEYMKDRTNG